MKILVTGANGFVGSSLCEHLVASGHQVVAAIRHPYSGKLCESRLHYKVVGDICETTDWVGCLTGIDCVIHLANRAHVMREMVKDPLQTYRAVNTQGTLRLAEQAYLMGVKRFIYLSSAKVNGESTLPGKPFKEIDIHRPTDAYAISKYEAEIALKNLIGNASMEVVIIRPPLIYGPGVKANFLRMIQWVESGLPVPVSQVENLRSLIGLDNLVDLIQVCVSHPRAVGQTFLVSDNQDLSTPQLIQEIAFALKRRPKLLKFHPSILKVVFTIFGKAALIDRLLSSFQLDTSHVQKRLNWMAPFPVRMQIQKTVNAYLDSKVHKSRLKHGL